MTIPSMDLVAVLMTVCNSPISLPPRAKCSSNDAASMTWLPFSLCVGGGGVRTRCLQH